MSLAVDYLASPLAKFRPWRTASGRSPQLEFLRAAGTSPVRVYRAGNRCGKSLVAAVDVLLRCCGWHPFFRTRAAGVAWIVGLDWDQAIGQVIWPTMKPWIPWDQVRRVTWLKKDAIPTAIRFRSGWEIHFKSAEARRDKFAGARLTHAWLDEEIPDEGIVEEVRMRLVDVGGDLAVTLTPVARKAWVRELEEQPGTSVTRASTREAASAVVTRWDGTVGPMLNVEALDRALAALPERQRRVREHGDWAALEGLVYPEFDKAVHVLRVVGDELRTYDGDRLLRLDGTPAYRWPLPAVDWPRYGAVDFGFANPTAVPVIAEEPATGRWFVERCYYASMVRATRWAEILKAELPRLRHPLIADHDADARAEFDVAGVPTAAARKVNNLVAGIEAVERALAPLPDGRPRLQLVLDERRAPHPVVGRYDAHAMLSEFEGYSYPKSKDGSYSRDLPVKKNDHALDSIRYLLTHLEQRGGGLEFPNFDAVPRPSVLAGMKPTRVAD